MTHAKNENNRMKKDIEHWLLLQRLNACLVKKKSYLGSGVGVVGNTWDSLLLFLRVHCYIKEIIFFMLYMK